MRTTSTCLVDDQVFLSDELRPKEDVGDRNGSCRGKNVLMGYHKITKQRSDGKLISFSILKGEIQGSMKTCLNRLFLLLRGVSPQ